MVSDEREITLRLNFSHLFLGEEKEAKKGIISLAPSQQKKTSDKDERNNKCQVLFYFHFIRQKSILDVLESVWFIICWEQLSAS